MVIYKFNFLWWLSSYEAHPPCLDSGENTLGRVMDTSFPPPPPPPPPWPHKREIDIDKEETWGGNIQARGGRENNNGKFHFFELWLFKGRKERKVFFHSIL